MKKETILLIVVTLAIGMLGGVIFTNTKKDQPTSNQSSSPAALAPSVNYQQQIQTLEGIVAKEPNNRNAWVQLGHNFFDSKQPMKAIDAYDKALALDANDPNVLTDQGVMFRRVGWTDKAITNFTKANQLDPGHLQSLFNLGIVYRDDLGDQQKTKEVWNKYLEISPNGKGSDQIRTMLQHMETGHQ